MATVISITQAKARLLDLARRNQKFGESFVVIKDSVPVSALIPFEEYESLLETVDILSTEPDVLRKLKKAEAEIKRGKFVEWKPTKKTRKAG